MNKRTTQSQDAISLLLEDHKKVQTLFKKFSKTRDDTEAMQDLVEEACVELMVHSQLEEELFYPAAREALSEHDALHEAEVEHEVADELIDRLLEMQPNDPAYAATFTVLCEYVNHHIEEEQKEIFPQVKRSSLDLDELGARMMERKEELMNEMGSSPPPPRGPEAHRPSARG